MDLHGAIGVQDQLREDEYIPVGVSELPVCQVNLIFACIPHDHPLGAQRAGAYDADDFHRDIDSGIKGWLRCRGILIDQGGRWLDSRLAN